MKKQNEYLEIDLGRLFHALWRNFLLLCLAAMLCGGGAFCYARFLVKPTYEASAMMYVNNSSFSVGSTSFSISNADLTAAQNLVDTYIVILNSRTVLNEVIRTADLPYDYSTLKKMISAQAVNNTEVFRITVTGTSPAETEHIANTIVQVLPAKISNVVDGSSVRVVDYAVQPTRRATPSYTTYVAVGMLLGLLLAMAYVVIRMFSDNKIRSEDYLTQTYDLPVLAIIPKLDAETDATGYYGAYHSGTSTEAKR